MVKRTKNVKRICETLKSPKLKEVDRLKRTDVVEDNCTRTSDKAGRLISVFYLFEGSKKGFLDEIPNCQEGANFTAVEKLASDP